MALMKNMGRNDYMKKFAIRLLIIFMVSVFSSTVFAAESAVSPDKTLTLPILTTEMPVISPSPVSAVYPIKPTPMEAGEPETEESLIVSADWVKINRANLILVDTRPEILYRGGHIPGAVNASWTYFANMSAPNGSAKWGTIWPPATMAKRLGALGINSSKAVVVYCDAGGWGQSGWALWILRMSGVKNARILEGGFTAWKKAGGVVSRTKHTNKNVAFSIPKYKANYLVSTEWIKNNLGKEGLSIIDVRTPAEYQGKIRPFQEKRAGHLPGAINIPLDEYVDDDYKFEDIEEIVALLEKNGVKPDSEIVVYDTAGVRAAFVTMAIRYAGYHKSQCYDAGFQAWAGDSALPIVKGEK